MANQADVQVLEFALKSQGLCRPCNYFDGPVERMDHYFNYLTQLYFFDQREFKKLLRGFSDLLKNPVNELGWAFRGYFAYLQEDYKDAATSFLEAIELSPQNLDNWLDYAFCLRHLGHDQASLKIIFNTQSVMKTMLKGSRQVKRARLMKSLKI